MTRPRSISRRELLALGIAGFIAGPIRAAASLAPTPRLTEGPFYPDDLPLDRDADLVRVDGHARDALGEATDLRGRVLDAGGRALRGVEVEIWQCDANGRYHHSGDASARRQLDPGFQGYGRASTDGEGRYRFRTIRPVAYPGRTPHIHFKLRGEGFAGLTTQMFVAGEPLNERDRIYDSLGETRAALTAAFEPTLMPDAQWRTNFDIVLVADGRFDGTHDDLE